MAIDVYGVRFKFSKVYPGTWLHGILLDKDSSLYIGKRTWDKESGNLIVTLYADDPDWASGVLKTEGPNDYTRKAFIEAWNWAKKHLPEYKDYPDYKYGWGSHGIRLVIPVFHNILLFCIRSLPTQALFIWELIRP